MTRTRIRLARAAAIITLVAAGLLGVASPSYAEHGDGCRSNSGSGFALNVCIYGDLVGSTWYVHPMFNVSRVPGGNCTVYYGFYDDTTHATLLSGYTGCNTGFWDLHSRPMNGHNYHMCAFPEINAVIIVAIETCSPILYSN